MCCLLMQVVWDFECVELEVAVEELGTIGVGGDRLRMVWSNDVTVKHHSFIQSIIHSLNHSFIHSFVHSINHSFAQSFIHSFIHSLTHSINQSIIHSFIHSTRFRIRFLVLVFYNPTWTMSIVSEVKKKKKNKIINVMGA